MISVIGKTERIRSSSHLRSNAVAMPVFSRQRFQRIRAGNIIIEVLEVGATLLKLEITAPQGHRILCGEKKLWPEQTMFRGDMELEEAAAKKADITHAELLAKSSPTALIDIRNPQKPTKLILERKKFEMIKIGPDIVVQVFQTDKLGRIGIEGIDRTEIELLNVSPERTATEMVRRRDATNRHRQWVANGGPERLNAKRQERKAA